MAKVKFKRIASSSTIDDVPIEDGQIITSGDGKMFVDYDDDRVGVGGTLDDEMSDDSTNGVENNVIKKYVDDSFDDISSNVLWTNTNPTSSFPSQTISLSNGNYKSIKVVYYDWTDSTSKRIKIAEIPKLSSNEKGFIDAVFLASGNLYWASRTILFESDTQLTFGNTTGANSSVMTVETVNSVCVPIKILGCNI